MYRALELGSIAWSHDCIEELAGVLSRPRFTRYVDHAVSERFVAWIKQHGTIVEPTDRFAVCRDPSDDKFLELAVAARAVAIITRDLDLLSLNPFRGIAIVEPEAFVTRTSDP